MNPFADITSPIHITSTYEVSWEQAHALLNDADAAPFYARYGNPTLAAVETAMVRLCGGGLDGVEALVVASGMAAISLLPFALLQPGDEIIATDSLYGGSANLLTFAEKWGITTKWVPCSLDGAEAQLSPRTRLLYVESPANPLNRLVPFERAVTFARSNGLYSVIDATLAPPPLQYALKAGFDIELHSATKMLNGHSDLLAGVLVARRGLIQKLRAMHRVMGAVLDARAAAELLRGMQTLPLRAGAISTAALNVAHWLEDQTGVTRVHYPGLESHPDHSLARRQMNGGGPIVAFDLQVNTEAAARLFVEALGLVRHAPSLGGPESLVSYPPLSSHAQWSGERLADAGIKPGTLRLSVGLEPANEIIIDLKRGLAAVSRYSP